ncbi:MAG TPA: VTT domain-containing protein [Candidatus Kapabacteria bacterium]|jgi:membrane-associated protein|nr:VTT domain-containing protein [Candidatus Kapabacteria bacterium]
MELLDSITSLLSSEGMKDVIRNGGYIALFLIIFAETGLLIGFFLPGDSLLVTTGLLIATGVVDMNIYLLNILLIAAAIIGDAVGYYIGKKMGQKLYEKPDGKIFKREHIIKTHEFYEKHGGKTIIIARFIPIVRTFAPVVAGAADMTYKKFATFNIIGGVLWITSTTFLGYGLGNTIPNVTDYLHYIIGVVILLSILPPIIEILKERKRRRLLRAEQAQAAQQ